MEIDPKVAIWIKIIYALVTAVSTGALTLTGLVPASAIPTIVAVAGVIGFALATVMTAYSSSQPGPLAPPDSRETAMSTVHDQAARTLGK